MCIRDRQAFSWYFAALNAARTVNAKTRYSAAVRIRRCVTLFSPKKVGKIPFAQNKQTTSAAQSPTDSTETPRCAK